jgi:hypothetical protein
MLEKCNTSKTSENAAVPVLFNKLFCANRKLIVNLHIDMAPSSLSEIKRKKY